MRRLASGAAQGRYVRIQLNSPNYLSLAEVQLFGVFVSSPPPDLAQNKPATQSSGYLPGATDAAAAVDGQTNGIFSDGYLTHTDLDGNAWWQVDLGTSTSVGSIVIWNRTECCGFRLSDYWVFVSNTPFSPGDIQHALSGELESLQSALHGRLQWHEIRVTTRGHFRSESNTVIEIVFSQFFLKLNAILHSKVMLKRWSGLDHR
jgi:hypothetical protein